ncbi:uncharacterized protein LOC131668716 [Phymastichus coffea]|uniref:uncharacterized protein LOC131668716 n=1 Tax=Phymastichus coffea TaxID=108790 RepID=UPI00273C3830|nr:uncharacterized protein LOC131668716 [Phymastichus coffea]
MLSKNILCYLINKKTPGLFHSFNSLHSSRTFNYALKQPYPILGSQNNFTNLLNNIVEKQLSLSPNSDVKQYLKDNAGHYRSTFVTLMDIFQIDKKTARSIISENQMLGDVPKKRLIHNYNKLKNAGISNQLIQDNVLLLMEDSNIFDKKLENTKKIVNNISDGICFMYCDISSLDLYLKQSTKRFPSALSELEFFQEQLKIDTRQTSLLILKYLNFITYHPHNTLKKLKLLLDYKVSINSLIYNNWPVYLPYARLKSQLELYSRNGLSLPIQPSIFDCDNKDFKKLVDAQLRKTENNYNKSEMIKFLSQKSGYNKALIEDRIPQNVFNSLSSLKNLTTKIEILLKEGYEYHDIIWSCNVLALPDSLITNRLSILKKLNHCHPNLDILLLSQGRFSMHVNNIQRLANKSK